VSAAEEEVDRLYALPLDEFTRARDELARRIRQEDGGEHAAEIKQLRKPTLPAWVVNQLARQRELDMQRLLKAGEQLAGAQAEAIRAQSGDAFLEARRDEQHALAGLAARATEILADAGRGTATLDRVLATLRAGSLTEEGRALLKSGRLTEELEPPGFEALAGLDIPRGRPPRPRPAKAAAPAAPEPKEPTQSERQRRRELAGEARRRVRDLRRDLRALETRAATAERQAAQLRKQLQAAEGDATRVDAQRRRAEEELEAAERDLEELTAET
jgi:hypothetical protein